ncbi:DUF4349 domain-containing protein [Enterococcus sp. LJL128]|uniref:DUF4349 domain-containing protein n=1 Tax=Enterococcus sp. LJL51 TaxID=3416656 RepID=UPI003CF5A3C4
MKLNQEWNQQWEDIRIPEEKIMQIIDTAIEEQSRMEKRSVWKKLKQKAAVKLRKPSKRQLVGISGLCTAVLAGIIIWQQTQSGQTNYTSTESVKQDYAGEGMLKMYEEPETAPEAESKTAEPSGNEAAVGSKSTVAEAEKTASFYTYTKQTVDFSRDTAKLEQLVEESGGYIENSERSKWMDDLRQANYVLRIPAKGSQDTLKQLKAIGETTDESIRTENYGVAYSDNESRIKALEAEESALLELLSKSEKLDDMLKIQDRLSEIRSEREMLVRSNKSIDNQVDYVTVEVFLKEKNKVEKKQESPSVTDRIQGNWEEQLQYWKNKGEEVLVFIGSNGLYILLAAIGGLLLWRKYRKYKKSDNNKSQL